jgi:hypothetical protein
MQFDLNQGSKGAFFKFFKSRISGADPVTGEPVIEYAEPEADAPRVYIQIADSETIKKIHAKTRTKKTEFVYNPKTRQMERVSYLDQTPEQEELERQLIWDHAIKEWEGMLDQEGKPIPCTLENKLKLMNDVQFARFVGKCLITVGGSNEDAEKN